MALSWCALVMHSDAGHRQSLRLCLEAGGARVLGVTSPTAAIAALERAHFDVALLAIDRHDDIAVIDRLRAVRPELGVVVLAQTPMFETAVEAMHRGAGDCLAVPYSPEHVRAAALRVLRRRVLEPPTIPTSIALGADVSLEALEREHIARIVARCSTLQLAARTLGIDATTLQRKRKRYGLL
jgi:DNA-binding NtrC family response regulator